MPRIPSLLLTAALALGITASVPAPLLAQQSPAVGILQDPGAAQREELLVSHGISTDAETLLFFLRHGFNEAALPKGLPAQPRLKSVVVDAAIQELGLQASTDAVSLLMEFASGQYTDAVERIIRRDFERLPVQQVRQQAGKMRRVLAMNSMVALGLIGDERAIPAVKAAMASAQETGFITNGALALGQMGSAAGIGPVVELAQNIKSPDSVAAFNTIYVLTGRNYGYGPNTSVARREQLAKELENWFAAEGAAVEVYRTDVLRRQQVPPAPTEFDPDSLRGLLRAARDAQIGNFEKRYAARERLATIAAQSFTELAAIVTDPYEDLDVRREAMYWLAMADPDKAERIIKRQRDDENAVIAEVARVILRDLPMLEQQLEEGNPGAGVWDSARNRIR